MPSITPITKLNQNRKILINLFIGDEIGRYKTETSTCNSSMTIHQTQITYTMYITGMTSS